MLASYLAEVFSIRIDVLKNLPLEKRKKTHAHLCVLECVTRDFGGQRQIWLLQEALGRVGFSAKIC